MQASCSLRSLDDANAAPLLWALGVQINIIERFESFAADFEAAVGDDDWSRLGHYLADDATSMNGGGPAPKCEGREAIRAFFQKDVAASDRRFDKRSLIALTPPVTHGDHLSRRWRCTYKLFGAPDLVMEGEARYVFCDGLIKEIEEEPTPDSVQRLSKWMQKNEAKLHT